MGVHLGDSMTIETQLDQIIAALQAVKPDATKCDKGQSGAPGTRVRKAASQATRNLKVMREAVILARNKK